jgi:uncharacterized membrane protein YfcA
MSGIEALYGELGFWTLVAIAAAALVTSTIHGAVGVAGGFLMTAALSLLIGVRPVVPVMSVALMMSHGTRSLLNVRAIDRAALMSVMIAAAPMLVIGALLYGFLPTRAIAVVLGVVILSSIPIRHWAHARAVKAGRGTLSAVGATYGFLAGGSIGAGMLLTPFMLGYGLSRESFVATMAVIALASNIIKIGIFGGIKLLDAHYLLMGVLIGLVMIPGNWIGRTFLRGMASSTHDRLIDFFAVVGGLNFFYLAATH